MDMNEVFQLAKTFSTACKETVEKVEVKAYATPVVLAALTVLLTVNPQGAGWGKQGQN